MLQAMAIAKALKAPDAKKRKRHSATDYNKVSFTRARCYSDHSETDENEGDIEANVDKTDKQMKEMDLAACRRRNKHPFWTGVVSAGARSGRAQRHCSDIR